MAILKVGSSQLALGYTLFAVRDRLFVPGDSVLVDSVGLHNTDYEALEVFALEILVVVVLVFSVLLMVGGIVAVIWRCIKDRRIEDAMQRQRERQNAEMWRRINEEVACYERIAPGVYARKSEAQLWEGK